MTTKVAPRRQPLMSGRNNSMTDDTFKAIAAKFSKKQMAVSSKFQYRDAERAKRVQELIDEAVDGLLKDNPDVQRAHGRMLQRGTDESVARDEIARAFLGCIWEVHRGMPERWHDVLTRLGDGASATELFPEANQDE